MGDERVQPLRQLLYNNNDTILNIKYTTIV